MAFISVALAALCVIWLGQAALTLSHLAALRTLMRLHPPDPAVWPRVSTIVPARDEATAIGPAIATRLADDYPDLEVIVVDDRSTDGTPHILAQLAARDDRLCVVRVDDLPDGWLGKVHALQRGLELADGTWLLLSDADIHLERGALRRAVALGEVRELDLIALVPEFRSRSIAVNVLWSTFLRVLAMALNPAGVRNPRSKAAAGSGSFMLVRRSAYDASPGFEHVRMETGDDMAFGAMMKQSGARCDFLNGRNAAWLPSYGSVREFLRGIEKNGATFAGTPLALVTAVMVFLGLLEYSPLLALATGLAADIPWLTALGVITTLAATATAVSVLAVNTGTFAPALLWPLGWIGMASGIMRSVWLAHRRGGVMWRGTFYSRDQLLKGQRFKLF